MRTSRARSLELRPPSPSSDARDRDRARHEERTEGGLGQRADLDVNRLHRHLRAERPRTGPRGGHVDLKVAIGGMKSAARSAYPPRPRAIRSLAVWTNCIYGCMLGQVRFAWDQRKSGENLRIRGFDFEFATLVFDATTLEREDQRRDYGEKRVIAIGLAQGIALTVVYTDRPEAGGMVRRIISARLSNRRERQAFFEALSQEQD